MRTLHSSPAGSAGRTCLSWSHNATTVRRIFRRRRDTGGLRRGLNHAVSVALVLALLCTSSNAAPPVIAGLAAEGRVSFAFWLESSGGAALLKEFLFGQRRPAPQAQEEQEERDAEVTRIQVYPDDVTVKAGQKVAFAAAAYDYEDAPVGGVRFTWRARDVGHDRPAHVSKRGDFEARSPGTYAATAEAAGRSAQVTVTVTPGEQRRPDAHEPGARAIRDVSSRDLSRVD